MAEERKDRWLTWPNLLTSLRIVLTVFVVIFLLSDQRLTAAGCFIAAALTDFFDGYIARRWNQVSKLGKHLDPVADRVLLVASFVTLFVLYRPFWLLWFGAYIAVEIVWSVLVLIAFIQYRERITWKANLPGRVRVLLGGVIGGVIFVFPHATLMKNFLNWFLMPSFLTLFLISIRRYIRDNYK